MNEGLPASVRPFSVRADITCRVRIGVLFWPDVANIVALWTIVLRTIGEVSTRLSDGR